MTRPIELNDPIYVAGHRGLVGSAVVKKLTALGYRNLILRSSQECDLTRQAQVEELFAETKPRAVIVAAAKVGGIYANQTYPAEFIYQNGVIASHVIHTAYQSGVERLIYLGSSCIYPRDSSQPIPESALLSGPLEPTNRAYAVAKILGIELCRSYNAQYGTRFLAVMPTNLYGPNDTYHPENAHVIPSLLLKVHRAKREGSPYVDLWGTGKPFREFLHSHDLARALCLLLELSEIEYSGLLSDVPLINVGHGSDISIRALAETIAEVVGYEGELRFDATKPDGTPRKLLDSSRIFSLGWKPQISLREGLKETYNGVLGTLDSFVPSRVG